MGVKSGFLHESHYFFNRKWGKMNLECFGLSPPLNIAFIKKHYYWQAWWKKQSLKLLTSKHFPLFNLFVNQKLFRWNKKQMCTEKLVVLYELHGWIIMLFVLEFRSSRRRSGQLKDFLAKSSPYASQSGEADIKMTSDLAKQFKQDRVQNE